MTRSKLDKIAGVGLLVLLVCAAGQIACEIYYYGTWLTALPLELTLAITAALWGVLLGLLALAWFLLRLKLKK